MIFQVQLLTRVQRCHCTKLLKPFRHCHTMKKLLGTSVKKNVIQTVKNEVPASKEPAVVAWIQNWFDGVRGCPCFPVNGDKISVLYDPSQFYSELKERIQSANNRVVLASLYLGNGELEQDLVSCMYNRLQQSQAINPEFKVRVLVDYTRGSRGKNNSRTMLLPLIRDFPSQARVFLYHTPNLRGLLKAIIPERFNETIGVTHLKVYLFDDCLIMSGANLSSDYFTDRQDRYILIEDAKEMCDYFERLITTVSKFSFELDARNTTALCSDFHAHPYRGSRRRYLRKVKKIMQNFVKEFEKRELTPEILVYLYKKMATASKDCDLLSSTSMPCSDTGGTKQEPENAFDFVDNQKYDTVIIPMLQMYDIKLRQDERVTLNLFRSAPHVVNLTLATAYFNLTKRYWNVILRSDGKYDIIMAHPEAMGFFNAAGMAGGVPYAYTHIAKNFYTDIMKIGKNSQIKFLEYRKPGWTFHGKGMWAELKNEHKSAFLTLIGSPNFGYRSVYRDLEAQMLMVTTNQRLTTQLVQEKDNFMEYTCKVDQTTFQGEDRNIPFWVFLIATFMRTFF